MQASFDSWRLAFVTLLVLPMALTGSVLAVLLGGGDISLGSLFGFFTVLGIALRNCFVLFSHYRQLEQHESQTWGLELVLQGAQNRLVPILMTALSTGLVLLPVVIAGSIAGYEMVHPIATVILGGLITSTLLSLFVLPTVFLRFGTSAMPVTEDVPMSLQPDPELAR
jgi:Cu/Ag efflux pump CusA